ncbi:hypothetical protein DFS33DRAFT_1383908 [Desarmillaria ectypa]|nr:hypothetical protein DFS33DRAFT_1383908 [Desarmillaria ectypa]
MADEPADSPAAAQEENPPRSTSIRNGANLLMELFSAELAGAMSNIHLAYKRQIEAAKASEVLCIAELEQVLKAREGVLANAETRVKQVSEENAQLLRTHQQLLQEFSDFRCAADISRKASSELSEQQIASLVAERDDARSDATAMQVEVQQLRNEMAEQKLEREALTERIKKLEGEVDCIRTDYKKADIERNQARDDAEETRGALAGLQDALGTIGLEYVQEDTKFYFSKEIIPQVADLFNEGQKGQAISLALASIQDKPDSTKKPLSPDALSPFNLAMFITIMKDILSDVVVAGSGWEALCRSKEKEVNELREQCDTLSTQLSRMKEAKDAAMSEWTEIKSTLAAAGLAHTDTNTIIFTKGLVSTLKELAPMKEKLKQTANTLSFKDPHSDLQALIQAPEPKLSTPQNLIASMRKWFAVAQAVGDASLVLCQSKEEEITELSVGRILQQDEIQLLNGQIKEAETQLKKLDAQSPNEGSSFVSQPTPKRRKSSRSSTSAALLPSQIASSSSQPFPGSTRTTNRMASDNRFSSPIAPTTDPAPSSRKRQRITLKSHTKPSSISVPTTSTTQRKRSPSVIIVGDSDVEISSKPLASNKRSPKGSNGRSAKRPRNSFVYSDDDDEQLTKLRSQGVLSNKDKDKEDVVGTPIVRSSRSRLTSKSSQISKGRKPELDVFLRSIL